MELLKEYLEDKLDSEQRERKINQKYAIKALDLEQETIIKEEAPLLKSLTYLCIEDFIQQFGYNPFQQVQISKSIIQTFEQQLSNNLKKNILSCIEVDKQLIAYFTYQTRFGTIEEEEEQEQSEQDSFGFDVYKGIEIQQEIDQLRQQNKRGSQRYQLEREYPLYKQKHSSQKREQPSQPDLQQQLEEIQTQIDKFQQDNNNIFMNIHIKQQKEPIDHNLEESYEQEEQYEKQQGYMLESYPNDVPQFGSVESQQFQGELQRQISHYSMELRKSLSQKQQFEQRHYQSNLFPTQEESPKRQKIKRQKQSQPQLSLLGSLFTNTALNEMQQLNDDVIPIQEYAPPNQYQEINVERAFVEAQKKIREEEHVNTAMSSISPFRMQIMEEIQAEINQTNQTEINLQTDKLQESQLSAISQDIYSFIIQLSKEVQSKGMITKQTQLKLNDHYKNLCVILKRPLTNRKADETINQKLTRAFNKFSEFFTPTFLQLLDIQTFQETDNYLKILFSPLVVLTAAIDSKFPLQNSKMPQITWKLIKFTFQNTNMASLKIKNFMKHLNKEQKFRIHFKQQYLEHFNQVESLLSNADSIQLLNQVEVYNIVRMIFTITHILEHFQGLVLEEDPKIILNDNQKYEKVWKEKGTRYASKKNKQDAVEQRNQEIFKKFGVDFRAWELNLQIQETELKKIKKIENDLQWQEKKLEKKQHQLLVQKENKEILEDNLENHKFNTAMKEHDKQKKLQEFRERQKEKTITYLQHKIIKNEEVKEMRESQSEQIIKQSLDVQEYKTKVVQEKHKLNKNRLESLNAARTQRKENRSQEQQKIEEERVWQRAQLLLKKQKELLELKQKIITELQL
ncbi:hypothetical protein pb186bvf_012549 [Paramecium bursaria]